jgi:molybdopterin synthase sulfur carrier subunit
MNITLQLFGRFRDFADTPEVQLDFPGIATVDEFRQAFDVWASTHWAGYSPSLLRASALASETSILQGRQALPEDGRMAVLPPVSGG